MKIEELEKKEIKPKKSQSKWEFLIVKYIFILLFLALIGHYVNFQLNESEEFINNDYNSREELFAERVTRGEIHSADGEVLATTIVDGNGNEKRNYPHDYLFSHVVGYSVNGKSGIEKIANFNLLRSHVSMDEKVETELGEVKYIGDNVITTLDYELQQTAYEALSFYEGAIVVMEPSTGKILAMVSKPDYNPNNVEEDWEYLISEDNTSTVLLNRATQGLYPPGSTFKIVTTLAYLQEYGEDYSYSCNGKITAKDAVIHCINNKHHGTVNLENSFAESCNTSYANIGLLVDKSDFNDLCETLLFNQELPVKFAYSKSSFDLTDSSPEADVVQAAIGQGTTLVTPFHMAMIISAIANDGVLMTPYVIDRVENHKGEFVVQYPPTKYKQIMTSEEAQILQEYMEAVVDYGTGTKLKSNQYNAAGKTGSAEFSSKAEHCHSWFVGYAKDNNQKDIAVAILVEEAGTGSSVAVPMAKEIFDVYFAE